MIEPGARALRIVIVSNLHDGIGLARDADILSARVAEAGHDVRLLDHRELHAPPADLTIFLEYVPEPLRAASRPWWVVPNPEWWDLYQPRLDEFERVLCKTRETYRIFAARTERAIFTGFESLDYFDPSVPRAPAFLHVAAESAVKGTRQILEAWRAIGERAPLTVVGSPGERPAIPGVVYLDRSQVPEVGPVMNAHWFHLCPSKVEGWGHTMHEGLAVGAIMVTTDLPPMNESAGTAFRISPVSYGVQNLTRTADVSSEGVIEAVRWCLELSPGEIEAQSRRARGAFERERNEFRAGFAAIMRRARP